MHSKEDPRRPLIHSMFLVSCALIVLATLVAKAAFLYRNRAELNSLLQPDPVLFLLTKEAVIKLALAIETGLLVLCACPLRIAHKARLLLAMAYVFFSYRVVYQFLGDGPCPCLGGDWEWLASRGSLINWCLYGSLAYIGLGCIWVLSYESGKVPMSEGRVIGSASVLGPRQ